MSVTCRRQNPKVFIEQTPEKPRLNSLELPTLSPRKGPQTEKKPSLALNLQKIQFDPPIHSPREKRGFVYGGYGGLLVAEHYRRMREIEEQRLFEQIKKTIAPALGSDEYFEWLARQGVDISGLKFAAY